MADSKITALTATTAPVGTDIAPIVVDPTGTPLNRKSTLANLITKAHGLADGLIKVASSVMAVAVAGTDYLAPQAEYDAGNSGATKTIDFANGRNQKLTMTANCTITLTNPSTAGHYQIRSVQNGTGTYTYAWTVSGTLTWVDGVEPTWTTVANKVNAHNFYFDGTNWLGTGSKFNAT